MPRKKHKKTISLERFNSRFKASVLYWDEHGELREGFFETMEEAQMFENMLKEEETNMTQSKHNLSIYAEFDTEQDMREWMKKHVIKESMPHNGPIFCFNTQDESHYRDLCAELIDALGNLIGNIHLLREYYPDNKEGFEIKQEIDHFTTTWINQGEKAIVKAMEILND